MENKELVEKEEIQPNENPQSEASLNSRPIPFWKRVMLLGMGLPGLFLIAFVAVLIISLFTKNETTIDYLSNILAYVILAGGMVCSLIPHFPECLESFKKWRPYVFGLVCCATVMSFDQLYIGLVNLFYPLDTGGNEEGIRGIIAEYPILSIIVLGILGPTCEELTYRTGLFSIVKKWNRVAAYIITAIVFGLIHFRPTAETWLNELLLQPVYMFSGAAFCFVYDRWGFASSFTAHTANNLYSICAQILLNIIDKYA